MAEPTCTGRREKRAPGVPFDEPMSNKDRSAPGGPDDGNVIHVVFGPGGGRVAHPEGGEGGASSGAAKGVGAEGEVLPGSAGEPVTDLFTASEVARLLGIPQGKLRALDRAGIVPPSGVRRGRRAYTFSDIIALRAARDLLAGQVRMRDVARSIDRIREALPRVTRPLAELRIVSDGQRVVVKSTAGTFEPLTGQMVLDFEVKNLRDDVVRVLRPAVALERARNAYDHYVRASKLDEDPATMDEAESLYRRAIELDPSLAIAYTNLGNICFRRSHDDQAEQLYRRALALDPAQPEAQYNLGYVMLERGHPEVAVGFFCGAIRSDPKFSDAYFNLAMAYEQLGDAAKARPCWRKYLELEPSGTWADIARKHL